MRNDEVRFFFLSLSSPDGGKGFDSLATPLLPMLTNHKMFGLGKSFLFSSCPEKKRKDNHMRYLEMNVAYALSKLPQNST
jgi:hypothetical protein